MNPVQQRIAGLIDHTLLNETASGEDHIRLCEEARKWNFRTVCVYPHFVELCVSELEKSGIDVCTVIDFPDGKGDSERNMDDALMMISEGAMELDMVMDINAFGIREYERVAEGIQVVVNAAEGRIVKVIIETCLWEQDQIMLACDIVQSTGAQFVKTSTGFAAQGAVTGQVKLMRETVGPEFGVKASGGIKTADDALAMIKAGATRIGTSSGVEIVEGL